MPVAYDKIEKDEEDTEDDKNNSAPGSENKGAETTKAGNGQIKDPHGSELYNLLLNHALALFHEGTPIENLEKFLHNKDQVESFFKERGHEYPAPQETPPSNSSEHADGESNESDEWESEDDEDEDNVADSDGPLLQREREDEEVATGRESCISKCLRFTVYLILFTIIALGGHIGICHLLDINPLQYFPSLQEKRCLLPAHPILMEMTRPIAECGFCSKQHEQNDGESNNNIIIEMKNTPNKTEFSKVAYLSKPVIIRGGGKNGGMPTSFSFNDLKKIFQSEPGGVDAVSEECQFLPFRSPFTTLREAFEKISENSTWEEPWYIGWSNCHPGVAAKLRELFPRPDFLPDDSSSSAIDWIFIGSPGLGASMHIDYVKRPSWQAQLSGVKRWILHPPPECESVCPESVTFTIYPGDLLFLETNTWYHETFIETFSISIGSEYD